VYAASFRFIYAEPDTLPLFPKHIWCIEISKLTQVVLYSLDSESTGEHVTANNLQNRCVRLQPCRDLEERDGKNGTWPPRATFPAPSSFAAMNPREQLAKEVASPAGEHGRAGAGGSTDDLRETSGNIQRGAAA
jgi:hypothetical protein